MRASGTFVAGIVAVSLGAAWIAHSRAAAACPSDESIQGVTEALRDEFHMRSVFINDVRTLSGGPFARRQDCAAEVAPITGLVDASAMRWRAITYTSARPGDAPRSTVTLQLGGATTLDPPPPGFWQRLRAYF